MPRGRPPHAMTPRLRRFRKDLRMALRFGAEIRAGAVTYFEIDGSGRWHDVTARRLRELRANARNLGMLIYRELKELRA